jgi:hypothetical protein
VNLKNRLGMIGNVVLLIVTVAAITMGGLSGMAIEQTLATMCAVQSTYYLGFLYVIYRHVAAVEIQPPREGDRLA